MVNVRDVIFLGTWGALTAILFAEWENAQSPLIPPFDLRYLQTPLFDGSV